MADDDQLDDLDLYEDEPMTSVRASAFSGNQLVIQNMDDLERKRQKRKRKRRKRLERLGKIAVCLCCLGSILALVLTLVLTKAAIAVTTPAPPTLAPTPMPAIPTYKPTPAHPTAKIPGRPTTKPPSMSIPTVKPRVSASPTFAIVDSYTLEAKQDTYIYTKGALRSNNFGKNEKLFVQTGIRTIDSSANAITLLIFDTSSIPNFDQLATTGKSAFLVLDHVPLDISDRNREAAPITVSRMDSTSVRIESVSGTDFKIPKTWDGPTVNVPVDATEVVFDITDIYFNTDFDSENQLFLMLQTRGQEQEVGDYFYSRESDKPPLLMLSGLAP
jgi:hypothetical protein